VVRTVNDQRTSFYGASRFTYNPERDEYRRPKGQVLQRDARDEERALELMEQNEVATGCMAESPTARCSPALTTE
jgi:hypothetical protein